MLVGIVNLVPFQQLVIRYVQRLFFFYSITFISKNRKITIFIYHTIVFDGTEPTNVQHTPQYLLSFCSCFLESKGLTHS